MKPEELKTFTEGMLTVLFTLSNSDYKEHTSIDVSGNVVKFWYSLVSDSDEWSEYVTLEYKDAKQFARDVIEIQIQLENLTKK
jgi:hypothetical protein